MTNYGARLKLRSIVFQYKPEAQASGFGANITTRWPACVEAASDRIKNRIA